jgi:spore germination protein KB
MIKKPKMSSIQVALLACGSALMFPYTFLPIVRGDYANQDVWLIFLVSIIFLGIISIPWLIIGNRLKNVDFYLKNELILGKAGGKIVSVLYAVFATFCYIACMQLAAMFVKIYVLTDTPHWAILLTLLVPIVFGSIKGAGAIGRIGTFIVPFVIATLFFFFIYGVGQMKISALMPILADSTALHFGKGAFLTSLRFSEIIILIIFSFFFKSGSTLNKSFIIGIVLFAVSFLLILLPVQMVVGVDLAKILDNPYLIYTRQVGGYDFFQRVQSLNTVAWFMGIVLKLTLYNYIASYILSGVFGAKDHKKYVIPLSVIAFFVCMTPFLRKASNMEKLTSDKVFPWIVINFVIILPLILLIVYFIRRKKITEKVKEMSEEKPKQIVGL